MSSPLVALTVALVVSAPGYERSRTQAVPENNYTQHCLFWDEPRIVFHQSTAGYGANDGSGSPDAEYPAIARSFATWNAVAQTCGNFALEEGPRLGDRTLGFDFTSEVNSNLILFRKRDCADVVPLGDECVTQTPGTCANKHDCWDTRGPYGESTLAVTTVSYDVRTGRIYDADMEFNEVHFDFTTVDGPPCPPGTVTGSCVANDLENTMTHEVGHFLGLGHTAYSDSTMYFSAQRGETDKRSLDPDSIQFVCDAYPKGYPSRDCELAPADPFLGEEVSGCASVGMGPSLVALGGLILLGFRRKRSAER